MTRLCALVLLLVAFDYGILPTSCTTCDCEEVDPVLISSAVGTSVLSSLGLYASLGLKRPRKRLIAAAAAGDAQAVEDILFRLNADPNAKFGEAKHCGVTLTDATAIIWASACKTSAVKDVTAKLLEAGADVDAQATNGYSALVFSAKYGNNEMVRLLLDHNAYIDQYCNCGFTSLMWAIDGGNAELVKLLLERGASLDVDDKRGNTPISLARDKGLSEIVNLLTEAGAQ